MAIQPGGEVWEDRRRLYLAVERSLALLAGGASGDMSETECVDFKEEAGRRGRGGVILPGGPYNQAVAAQLADEVACLANTPSGGALIVGVADDGALVGAETDRDWLRQRIHERVEVAPAVEVHHLPDGTRLLVVLVAEAREPVENTRGQLRWRVGKACAAVDRSEWWAERLRRQGADPLLAETTRRISDLAPGALPAVRRLLRQSAGTAAEIRDLPDRELLTRLGVLLPSGNLTAAGVHMFCVAPRTVIELVALDVSGGDVISSPPDLSGLSLIEQLSEVESRLDVFDTSVVLRSGLHLEPVRQIPWLAVREALLNAIVHRDWLPAEPVHITWIQADSTMEVRSPGGFAGGITADSVLSARYSRNPAVADLARALGLVEKQGVGVDRMYREMLALGHRPPIIREEPGPSIRTRLVGGSPLAAVMAAMVALEPPARQRDVRIALVLHALFRDGFVTSRTLAPLLQVPPAEADEALDVAATCVVDGRPLVRQSASGPWLPGAGFVTRATADAHAVDVAKRRALLTWWRPDRSSARRLVAAWLESADRITSGDFSEMTTLTNTAALKALNRLVEEGLLARGDAARGRRAHFVAVR